MARPLPSDVHVNRPLTNISVAYMQDQGAFMASRIFPDIPSDKQSNMYFIYNRADWLRDEVQQRAPSTESAGGDYKLSQDTFFAPVWAFHKDVDDQTRANQDDPINLDREATEFVALKMLIRRERIFMTTFFQSGVWLNEVTGVNSGPTGAQFLRWNDPASNPIEDIRTAKRTMASATGFRPNVLALGRKVYDTLLDHPDIIDRIKYGQTPGGPAIADTAALAALFQMEEVLVSDAVYNSANEGATEATGFMAGNHALLAYRPARPGLMTPAAGYTFTWNGYTGATNMGTRVSRFRMENIKSDRVEIEAAFVMKVVATDMGYFFNTAVA